MFSYSRDIDSAYRQMRRITLCTIAVNLIISSFAVYQVARSKDKAYVLAGGSLLEATLADRRDLIPVIARSHIQTFHQYFWTLDPDEKGIRDNIGKALYLADGSARAIFDDLRESGFYAAIVSGNVTQTITVDSIDLDTQQYPYPFRCWCTEQLIRPTTRTTRRLTTSGRLRSTGASPNNQLGFLIERLRVLDNKDILTENR